MPRSEDVAASFVSQGGPKEDGYSTSGDVDICDMRNVTTLLGFNADGFKGPRPEGVNYDPKPWRQNPGAVVDNSIQYDAEGKPLKG